MNTFLTRRKPFLLAALLAFASLCSWADAGHDHGEAPAIAAGPAKPRFTATSEAFELVGVVNGKHLTLYLDHAADNRPVKDAKLELELGGTKLAVQPHGEGEFEAALAAELQPGVISVTATVVAGQHSDLLAGDLDIHADTHAADAAHGATWKPYAVWAMGGLLALVLLAFVVRRLNTQRNNRLGGAA
ncbi:MAG: hypothetical protein V4858_26945 [Pseudomonadota bacterium]